MSTHMGLSDNYTIKYTDGGQWHDSGISFWPIVDAYRDYHANWDATIETFRAMFYHTLHPAYDTFIEKCENLLEEYSDEYTFYHDIQVLEWKWIDCTGKSLSRRCNLSIRTIDEAVKYMADCWLEEMFLHRFLKDRIENDVIRVRL